MKIAFIGGGNMGRAMLAAIIEKGIARPSDIAVSDKKGELLEQLKQDFNVNISADNLRAVGSMDIIVLAVKPQNLDAVMLELKDKLDTGQLLISIIAGRSIENLQNGLGQRAVVRVMPNTPAQIGMGMSVWTVAKEVTPRQKAQVKAMLSAMGDELFVEDETAIDMATAISGSGPAYVFLFMQSLAEAAVEIGLPADTARRLVLQTVAGSAEYAGKSGRELVRLREMVTSPGGTTAEALKVFEKGNLPGLVKQAAAAAYRRAKELRG